jgi:DNA polymerase-4
MPVARKLWQPSRVRSPARIVNAIRQLANTMRRRGIETGADLRAKSFSFLQQHFGKSAAWYLGIANGEDDRPVVTDRPRKSSGSETTFERDLSEPAEIEAGVQAMADDVWAWCEKARAFGRTVTVKVKFADFRLVTRSRSFSAVIACHDLLRRASIELVRTVLPTNRASAFLASPCPISRKSPAVVADELPLFADEAASASFRSGLFVSWSTVAGL